MEIIFMLMEVLTKLTDTSYHLLVYSDETGSLMQGNDEIYHFGNFGELKDRFVSEIYREVITLRPRKGGE